MYEASGVEEERHTGGNYMTEKISEHSFLISLIIVVVLAPATIALGILCLGDRKYYFISFMLIAYSIILMIIKWEGRKPKARELVVIAALAALAVAGRALFYAVPFFKPVCAIVIISAAAFGESVGFLVGALAMLVSNFFFGQGPWTPWQMFAFGAIGYMTGILYRKKLIRRSRIFLCVYGFVVTIVVYGGIMNPAALIMYTPEITLEGLIAVYISGFPVDMVHASGTAFFLFIGAMPLLEKLERIKNKYGLISMERAD